MRKATPEETRAQLIKEGLTPEEADQVMNLPALDALKEMMEGPYSVPISQPISEETSKLDSLRERLQSQEFREGLMKVHEDNHRKHREMFYLPAED